MLRGKESFDEVRTAAGLLCGTLSGVISLTRDFATCFLVLVDSLRTGSPTETILQNMSAVVTRAESNAKELDKAEKEVARFAQSIKSAVDGIRSSLEYRSGNNIQIHEISGKLNVFLGAKPIEDTVPTEEISEVVNEMVRGLHKCGTSLRQCTKYYKRAGQQYSNTGAFESDPPSKEEIEMAQERWVGFSKHLKDLTKGFGRIRRRLEKPPTARRYDDVSGPREADETSSLFSDSDSETDTQTGEEGEVRAGHRRMFSGFWGSVFRKGFREFWSNIKAGIRGKAPS